MEIAMTRLVEYFLVQVRNSLILGAMLASCGNARAITIDTVPVGNPGNANDPATGNLYGGVSYAYSIDKYEVTVGQYAAFLNAVASTDTYSLYNSSMATDLNVAGIARSGASGSYSYSVIGSPNHPITYVGWGDAARFSNWLNNGQPVGAEGPSTTERGAYTLDGVTTRADLNAVSRNANAKWFIPSESEWYKAAYHQPAAQGGDTDNYWNYPMRTNSEPYSDQPPGVTPDNTQVGNFDNDDGVANGYNDGYAVSGSTTHLNDVLTDVGAYTSSPSFYGTYDQGGNVYEWNEALISGSYRGVRGGAWDKGVGYLPASARFTDDDFNVFFPTLESAHVGFRVATVPTVPGDFNGNGVVDAADYTVWRNGLGTAFTQADYNVWKSHFGQSTGSGSVGGSEVPEPGTMTLSALAAIGLLVIRRQCCV
jgi:formylglycine-generating enzyme required for sulfatase activity